MAKWGEFVAAWGWGVSNGKENTRSARATVAPVWRVSGKGEFKEAGAIAVDNAPGGRKVYVDANAGAKRPDVERFTPMGKSRSASSDRRRRRTGCVSTDCRGTVWVYRGEEEEEGVHRRLQRREEPVPVDRALLAGRMSETGVRRGRGRRNFYLDHELFDSEEECPAAVEREKEEEDRNTKPKAGMRARWWRRGQRGRTRARYEGVDRRVAAGHRAVAVDQASGGHAVGRGRRGGCVRR